MDRYQRNELIDGIGKKGQQKLLQSKVLVIGAGGLGSPVLQYLAAVGVGTLGIVDYDVVDITNLQRQVLHFTEDVGNKKVESAIHKLHSLNPNVNLIGYDEKLTQANASSLINQYDFVIDCCDNYEAKLLINDVCVASRKPFSHGAVLSMKGEVMTYIPGSACYRCVFSEIPIDGETPTSSQVGILGAVAGTIGTIQATETIKYLTGAGELLINRLLIYDARKIAFLALKVKKNDACICSANEET